MCLRNLVNTFKGLSVLMACMWWWFVTIITVRYLFNIPKLHGLNATPIFSTLAMPGSINSSLDRL